MYACYDRVYMLLECRYPRKPKAALADPLDLELQTIVELPNLGAGSQSLLKNSNTF